MRATLIGLALAVGVLASLAGCASTPQDRGPFQEYLHEHGLE